MPVAFTSAGYGGAVTQESWARLSHLHGHSYAVTGNDTVNEKDAWAVTPAVGDRAIAIAPGIGFGHGVLDETSDTETMFIPAVTSGTSRYDLVVARRDWSTKTTTFALVSGASARTLPVRANNPGFLDEHPIALVKVNAGSTAIAEVVDLRVWATDGGMVATEALVRTFLNHLGARIKIAGEIWSYEHITPTTVDWVNEDGSGPWVDLVLRQGWVNNGNSRCRARLVGRGSFVHVQADVTYPPGQPAEGWIIADLPVGLRPKEHTFVPGTHNGYRSGTVYSVYAGGIAVGPFPQGNVYQLGGTAPMK